MTQVEMTENLSEKCHVTLEEARNALEAGDWNPLTAAQQIEVEKVRRMQELEAVASDSEAMADGISANRGAVTAEESENSEKSHASKRRRGEGLRNVGDHICRLVACGNRNRFVVKRDDSVVVELPVTALALLLLCAFWVCAPLLGIGLFAGCRYSFQGRDLGRENINSALDRAADAAGRLKESAAKA